MALDPAAVSKYGYAGARRRAQRQASGVSDVRKLTPQMLQQYKQGGSGLTKGLGFDMKRLQEDDPGWDWRTMGNRMRGDRNYPNPALLRAIARKRKGGPAGGRPVMPQKGGTAGGKPNIGTQVSAARHRRRRLPEDHVFNMGPRWNLLQGLRHYHSGTIH